VTIPFSPTFVLTGDGAGLVVELQRRTLGEGVHSGRLGPDVDEIELDAALAVAIAFQAVGTNRNTFITFEMAFSTRQTTSSDSFGLGRRGAFRSSSSRRICLAIRTA
jgi:hypothetical protein